MLELISHLGTRQGVGVGCWMDFPFSVSFVINMDQNCLKDSSHFALRDDVFLTGYNVC